MKNYPLRYFARVTIEFITPFHIGSGREGAVADAAVVSDANGLPAIPGSSLAGALRAAASDAGLETNSLFGFQKMGVSDSDSAAEKGQGSRLTVSWAALHDSHNQPVVGLAEQSRLDDPVLAAARALPLRDHVRISHRGVADDRGKFDELCAQTGHRFTFELELSGNDQDRASWAGLLQIIGAAEIRLGGKTRRGFGAFKTITIQQRCFDLKKAGDFHAYSNLGFLAGDIPGAGEIKEAGAPPKAATCTLTLKPRGYWMFGGGVDDEFGADMAPVREEIILWENGKGRKAEDLVLIPASSIKGALSHRVAFHYNRIKERFADGQDAEKIQPWAGEDNPAVKMLFGCCKDADDGKKGKGQRGRVIINDVHLSRSPKELPQQIVHHVAIDRYTGGAYPGALFQERPFWQGPSLVMKVMIVETDRIADSDCKKSLQCALADLAGGRLALGAGAGRGLGFFEGRCEWNEIGQKWLGAAALAAQP